MKVVTHRLDGSTGEMAVDPWRALAIQGSAGCLEKAI